MRLGALGESIAQSHLKRAGYEVLDRNARCGRLGELDIVAATQECLVFCEVKTRIATTRTGPDGPLDAIGPAKQRRLRRLAAEWLRGRPPRGRRLRSIRFDAIGVTLDRSGELLALDHVENAF
jgi:putative endonuclease